MIDEFFRLPAEEIREGVAHDGEKGCWRCILCGKEFHKEEVYPAEGRFYTARRAAGLHVAREHPPLLEELLSMDGRYLTLTENQKDLLCLMGKGAPDAEIAKRMGTAASTVRHQRFMFREKAKQARLYLAVYELAERGGRNPAEEVVEFHNAAVMDDRFIVTRAEQEKILTLAFSSLSPLRLEYFPHKEKKKVVVLERISAEFQAGRRYTEKEVNAILKEIFSDYVTLRRYLIEYGYLERLADGSAYWVREGKAPLEPDGI